MTRLRKMMLEELQRRNYAQTTAAAYTLALRQFAEYFRRPPDQLGPEHIREFQLDLLRDRRLAPTTVKQRMAAVQFFFAQTLKRPYLWQDFPYPKVPRRLPVVLIQDEVAKLIGRRQQSGASRDADDALLHGPASFRSGSLKVE
ncbi:MAG TPA: site-specific integrase [Bryobacteraceae bacterium]|nr:site-specific integrase [Bryobacteraceae bacterium]